jgi:hypothetical protein
MRLETGECTSRRRAWKRPRALSFLHPFSKLRGLSSDLLVRSWSYQPMPWILVSLISEFGPELRAWQERCGKDTWIYFVTLHCKFETGLKSSFKPPSMVVGYHVVRVNYNTIAIRLLTGNSGCNGNLLAKGHRLDSLVCPPSLQ